LEENPMRLPSIKYGVILIGIGAIVLLGSSTVLAQLPGWDGKRHISYQAQKDLFYNYYAQPGPFNGAAAQMYVCPKPVPAFVGHTWVTYQPWMPHEYTYRHERSYYTYNPGAGWRRTNVRYGTCGLRLEENLADLRFPMSYETWALHNDYFYPGLRF
jgi:hypothetical protein